MKKSKQEFKYSTSDVRQEMSNNPSHQMDAAAFYLVDLRYTLAYQPEEVFLENSL